MLLQVHLFSFTQKLLQHSTVSAITSNPAPSLAKHYPKFKSTADGGHHNYSLFNIHYTTLPQHNISSHKNGAGSRPLRLIIFCLLLYPLTAQDLRKQRQDRQYSYKLCRMCSYRPQRNIRYPDRRTGDCRH